MGKTEITFKCPDGISISPQSIKISNPLKGKDRSYPIQITCSKKIPESYVEVIRKKNSPSGNDMVLGKLQVADNHTIHSFNYRLIKVLRKEHEAEDRATLNELMAGNEHEKLNTNAFQQVFIEANLEGIEEFIIDEKEYLEKGYLVTEKDRNFITKRIEMLTMAQTNDNPLSTLRILYYDYIKNKTGEKDMHAIFKKNETENYNVLKGINVFILPLRHKGGASGEALFIPTQYNGCILFSDYDYSRITHEISHCLGLSEAFKDIFKLDKEQGTYKVIEKNLIFIKYKINEIKEKLNSLSIIEERTEKEENELNQLRNELIFYYDRLNYNEYSTSSVKIIEKNTYHIYKQHITYNFMDYHTDNNRESIKCDSFYKWQLKIMHNEIENYHG